MSEQQQIAALMKASIEKDAWFGPSLFEALDDITAEQAAAQPIDGAHSIWELVGHIAVWVEVPLTRFHGEGPETISDEQNFPRAPRNPDENAWEHIKSRVRLAHDAWYAELESMSDEKLHSRRKPEYPTMVEILYGVVQHTAYHTGQIVLLKKMV